jgi:3-oxoacyl-[acyl-carrier protein] reductase
MAARSGLFDLMGRSALVTGAAGGIGSAVARAGALGDGAPHVLVNNAGVTAPAMVADLTEDAFRRVVDVHVPGVCRCARAALPFLPSDGTGRIVDVTSSAGTCRWTVAR